MLILAVLGVFTHFIDFQVILLVLEILRLFWSIKRFLGGGGVWTFCGFWGILEILVILGVYWPFLGFQCFLFFVKKNYFTRENFQNIKK